jgi:phage replisome organizer, putative, N-terminal region
MIKMKERRYVKFKVDIYDDTKTKIIDQRPERDFIHYFFARSIILAGKSDCEGELYMAKDIPYTIETLAIEFSRDAALIKLALDVLIELKMIEVTKEGIYKVKNFAKHQNIKEKGETKDSYKGEVNARENNKKIDVKYSASSKETEIKEEKHIEDVAKDKIQEEADRKNQDENRSVAPRNEDNEMICNNLKNADVVEINIDKRKINAEQDIDGALINKLSEENTSENSELSGTKKYFCNINEQQNIESNSEESKLINLEMKENKKIKKQKSKGKSVTELAVEEIEEDVPILSFFDGDMPPLEEGERLVWELSPV